MRLDSRPKLTALASSAMLLQEKFESLLQAIELPPPHCPTGKAQKVQLKIRF